MTAKAKISKTPSRTIVSEPFEITYRSIFLGTVLSILLAMSTCYLGLKVGRTISGSIPAAVMSMAILRFFRGSGVLENNIVQTAASAGEVVAAGVIFTLPALILIGYWETFSIFETTMIALLGGTFGVLFSVPLRRAMIIEKSLPFPEGIAIGQVLKAGDTAGSAEVVVRGGIIGAVIAFLQTGLKVLVSDIHVWGFTSGTVAGFSFGLSPILVAAGFIVGMHACVSIALGMAITWVFGIPLYGYLYGVPEMSEAVAAARGIHMEHFRYVGVGVMMVGGLWGVATLMKPIRQAIKLSYKSIKMSAEKIEKKIIKTEQDIPMHYVMWGIVALIAPLWLFLSSFFGVDSLPISSGQFYLVMTVMTLATAIVGALASALSSYQVGYVGSSSLPISGIVIAVVVTIGFLLHALFVGQVDFALHAGYAMKLTAFTLVIAAIVAITCSIGGDNMQDLKAGQIVGATPWKQQVMLIVGVLACSAVIAPTLNLLLSAYGMGDVLPRADMDPTKVLAAPQATLMATVAKAVFSQTLQWPLIGLGAAIAFIAIFIDLHLERRKSSFRLSVLSLAVGMYLPMFVIFPLVLGGFLSYFARRSVKNKGAGEHQDQSIMLASGIIAGESLMGIVIAIPFALYDGRDMLALNIVGYESLQLYLSVATIGWVMYYLYTTARAKAY